MTVLSRSKNAALGPTGRKCSRKSLVTPHPCGTDSVTRCDIGQMGSTVAVSDNRYSTVRPY